MTTYAPAPEALDKNRGFRSVLVAVDLTPSTDRVLGRLARLPLKDGAHVTMLHVVPSSLSHREQRRAERDASKIVADEIRHYRQKLPRHVQLQPLVQTGVAARTIGTTAARMKADLVVMGRGSGKVLRDEFLGSTAERVVRQAKIPVLVVRLPARARYARPALAVAVDDAAYHTVAVMLKLLTPPRPAITVIHAFDTPYRSFMYTSLAGDDVHDRTDELQERATSEVTMLLRRALTRANVPASQSPVWKLHVRLGAPRAVVDRAVTRNDNDLLVLGTRAHAGATQLVLGTVAGDLLRRSQCDVLVVPPAD